MKRLIFGAVAAACLVATTGCTGSFNLTRNLWNWHRDFDSKWTDETLFLVLTIIPVYPVAMLGDAFIFNLIEFWDGSNPVRSTKVIEADDGSKIALQNNEDGTLTVSTTSGTFSLTRGAEGVVAKDADGKTLYTSKQVEQRIEVKDTDGNVQAFDL